MIVKTRQLTESLNKLYEAYEVETDDELDAIMDDDTLSDEEKEAEIGRVLDKHDKLNEGNSCDGWIAFYNGKKLEIPKSDVDGGIYEAKQKAIKELKVPKSKIGLLSIKPAYNESLNEAQLNENPLIAAAARAAIPAAINVASNAISSAIDAKLHDGNDLEEDFWDPGEEFQNFEYLLYDEFDESGWNEWDQIQRDAFAEKVAKRYLELNPTPTQMFYDDLTDNNFHTYRKAFERLLGESLTEAEGSDNELSFNDIMAKEKTSGNMDWYKKDKPNWKQVTEEE